jgi:hypothetical protein
MGERAIGSNDLAHYQSRRDHASHGAERTAMNIIIVKVASIISL